MVEAEDDLDGKLEIIDPVLERTYTTEDVIFGPLKDLLRLKCRALISQGSEAEAKKFLDSEWARFSDRVKSDDYRTLRPMLATASTYFEILNAEHGDASDEIVKNARNFINQSVQADPNLEHHFELMHQLLSPVIRELASHP